MTAQNAWELTSTPDKDIPAALATASLRVGRDLTADSAAMAKLGPTMWQLLDNELAPAGWPVFGLKGPSGTIFGTGIDVKQDEPETTARVAEAVQDHLTGYEFITWPLCPGHQHPMQPATDAKDAWWRCPTDQRLITRIGHLAHDRPNAAA